MDLTKTSNGKYCSRSSRNLLAQKTLEADPGGTRAMSSTGHPLDTSHRSSLEGPPGALLALPQTCRHRCFQRWVEEGVLSRILEVLAQDLKERGEIDLSECYI
jgi:hypothetical protein